VLLERENWSQKWFAVAMIACAQLNPGSPLSRCWRSEVSVASERCASRMALAVLSLSSSAQLNVFHQQVSHYPAPTALLLRSRVG
jgi:hypothetical protein